MDDRSSDRAERQLGSATPGWDRNPRNLLGLDGRGHGGVAEQRRRDAEVTHRRLQALTEQPAAARQQAQPCEQPHAGPAHLLGALIREQITSRDGQSDQGHNPPAHEHGTLDTRQVAVLGEHQQRQRRGGDPERKPRREHHAHRRDHAAEPRDGKRQERHAPEKGAGRRPRQTLGVGGDSGHQVLGLKARQHHGQHERSDPQGPPHAEQAVNEQVRGPDDQHDPTGQRRQSDYA